MAGDHEQRRSLWLDVKSLSEERGISKDICIQCIEKALISTLIKKYPEMEPDDFLLEYDDNASTMSVRKKINPESQSKSLSGSRRKSKSKNEEEIDLKQVFNEHDVHHLSNQLSQNISFEKSKRFYKEYKESIGELILVTLYRFCKGYDIVKDRAGNELIFNESEKGDFKRKSRDNKRKFIGFFKVYVKSIENKAGKVKVYVSRAGEYFIKKLLEENIPEIKESGSVVIKKIVRDVNLGRSKVVVDSIDDKIDCIGSCIGPNKCRINAITKELNNEAVDFVKYSSDLSVFIANALGIPSIEGVNISEKKRYIIYVKEDYYDHSLAHARLLQMLLSNERSDNKIEIYKYSATIDSLEIDELKKYFDKWIVDTLKKNKEIKTLEDIVKKYNQEDFGTKFDLEEETVDNIYTVSSELIKRKSKQGKR